jgi:hypothetical protein
MSSYQEYESFITLEWEGPAPQENLPILHYRITCESEDVHTLYLDSSITAYKVRGLEQHRIYQFYVAAENANGYGEAAAFPIYQPGCHKFGWV